MDPERWLGFVVASALMGLVPGPGVLSIVGYALTSGRRTALVSVAGMALGNILAMSISLAGVGALLAASAMAFAVLKWAGALYLITLGVIAIARSSSAASNIIAGSPPIAPATAFRSNLLVGTFHPKTIVFFVSFVPQFIVPERHYLLQAGLLVLTFAAVVAVTDTLYALLASRAAAYLTRPDVALWSTRIGGGALVCAGVATAAAQS